ncbi:MAG: 5-formyltetrahydrofolate cyclo-ligase [Alphaproteobacteria bacterium]|nr:5-formyltetrahydrofolate cyclo-ligase [Alphaproteobacteria bacterium]MCB9931056.1 5-formyltetrahydrofolate cyclo-ligase [Alphaproteobacteria bacterium]
MNRRETRQRLRAMRRDLSPDWIAAASADIAARLDRALPQLRSARFAFTWPMAGEPDLREAAGRWVAAGARAALPETVRGRPLIFRPWTPGCVLRPGVWEIPVPVTAETVTPDILLIPCLGFDEAGYRLGNGGGYYDRTLAAMVPRPLAVGVGWSETRLPTIAPEPHDIPMDAIVTERAVIWHRPPPA